MKNIRIFKIRSEKNMVVSDREIIENALEQEKSGILPHYARVDYKTGEKVSPAGWLVISSYYDGCAVVYRKPDGKTIVTTGFQADFAYI